jgi:HK97 family phage portal protein
MRSLFGSMGRSLTVSNTRVSAGVPSYGMIPPLGSVQSSTGMLVSQATAMGVSTVYACVNRLATDLARCTPRLYTLKDDGTKQYVTDHPILAIFKRPNAQQTWFEFAWQMWVGHYLRGNCYAAIKRDRRGDPYQLIPINPDAVFVLESGEGNIFYNVNRIGLWQIAQLREFPTALAEDDMLHIRGLTFNSLVGVSTIGLARDAIGLGMGLEQQGARWMANGARPSVWLKTAKQLSEIAATRLKTQFDNKHSGIQNTGQTVVLEEGLEPVALQLNSVDLQFMSQREFQIPEICRFFGVPPHKVGVVDRGSVQNIAQQDQDYVNTAITQKCVLAEQKLETTFGLIDEGIHVELDQSQLLRADIMTRRNAARLGIISGLTTPNEERRGEGLAPKDGGDVLLVPANSAALGSEATGLAPDGAGRPPKGTVADPGGPILGNGKNSDAQADANESQDVAPQN